MKVVRNRHFWLVFGLLIGDGLFFGLTNPARVPAWALIVGFGLLAISFYYIWRGLLMAASWYGLPARKHNKRLAGVLSGLVTGLLALQSIGELTTRDVLVLLPLALIMYLYMSYGRQTAGN